MLCCDQHISHFVLQPPKRYKAEAVAYAVQRDVNATAPLHAKLRVTSYRTDYYSSFVNYSFRDTVLELRMS